MTDTYTWYPERKLLLIFQFFSEAKANYPNLFASNTPLFLSISKQDGVELFQYAQYYHNNIL